MRNDKHRAIRLRQQGKSYNVISQQLSIPKSTLSYWFRDNAKSTLIKNKNISRSKKIWAKNITLYNKSRSKETRRKWIKKQRESSSEIKNINQYELKLIGTALYWAEGFKKTKYTLTFCNSDPDMIKIIMKFFRRICKVDESKFKAQVQIHPNVSEIAAKRYWSKISSIQGKRFRKSITTISRSSKRKRDIHTLPYGTFRIHIHDVKLVHKIKGWIDGLKINI